MDKLVHKKYWKVEIKKTVEYVSEICVKSFQKPSENEIIEHNAIESCDWDEEDTDLDIGNIEKCEEDDCDEVIDLQPNEGDEKIISEYDESQLLFEVAMNAKIKKEDCYKNLVELES